MTADRAVLTDAIRAGDAQRIEGWLASGTPDVGHLETALRLARYDALEAMLRGTVTTGPAQLGDLARALAFDPDEKLRWGNASTWKQRAERNGRVLSKLAAEPEADALVDAYLDWERDGRVAFLALSALSDASPVAGPASKPCLAVGARFLQLEKNVLRTTRCSTAAEALARLPKIAAKKASASTLADAKTGTVLGELARLGVIDESVPADSSPLQLLQLATWRDDVRYRSRVWGVFELFAAKPDETTPKRWVIGVKNGQDELLVDDAKTPRVYRRDHENGRLSKGETLLAFLTELEVVAALD